MGFFKDNNFLVFLIAALICIALLSFFIDSLFPSPQINVALPRNVDDSVFSGIDMGTSPQSDVNFILFGDPECPYTAQMKDSLEHVYSAYNSKVNFVLKLYPTKHESYKAAEAVKCASDQYKGWEYFFFLLGSDDLSVDSLKSYAQNISLDTNSFAECLDSGSKSDIVAKDVSEAVFNGIVGTPTMIIGGMEFKGIQTEATLGLAVREALK